jgi:hypothetical protein
MPGYDPMAFEYVLAQVRDGHVFERFAQDLLCQVIGENFTPIGGVHDGGVDGLEHCVLPSGSQRTVYQMSVEADSEAKIAKTLTRLKEREVECARFFYVTNRRVTDQDALEERIYNRFGTTVKCRDVLWLAGHVNSTEGTLRTYLTFVEAHFHQFSQPGASPIVMDFESDPRLFVFLRQQWESSRGNTRLDHMLTDSLILFALEGTDPDLNILRSREEILEGIKGTAGFSSKLIETLLDDRLKHLSRKPRRIKHHQPVNKYCLPYETRLELQEKNVRDAALHDAFHAGVKKRLSEALTQRSIVVRDPEMLVSGVINKLFKQQGIEFADFIGHRGESSAVEKSLADIISEVVDASAVIPKNRMGAKSAVLEVARHLIYRGTDEEIEYLRKLANSYTMLFFLQCDPQLATYFSVMAGRLQVYVDNSLLVPAISELPLAEKNRRHWNLLAGANKAGVTLYANRATVSELAGHIRKSLQVFKEMYAGQEGIYEDDTAIAYIDQILIRSYFYSRLQGEKETFEAFIDRFVTPNSSTMEDELIQWLQGTFGIRFVENNQKGLEIDPAKLEALTKELEKRKHSSHQAMNDARTVLTVYAQRERDGESGDGGGLGCRTWWLSKDTVTQRAVENCFGKQANCYMRPDFLYNFICLAPTYSEVSRVFDVMFPSILGVNISHHIPQDVTDAVRRSLKEYGTRDPARVRAVLRSLSDRLKTEVGVMNGAQVKHYLDEQLGAAAVA